MAQVTKPYVFTNQTTADAGQVNQDFDTLYTLVDGNIDGTNIKDASIGTADLANGAVTPIKTEGLPYAQDLFSNGFVLNGGLTVTKDGTQLNQVNVTAGTVYILQPDGTSKRYSVASTNFRTATASNTYNLDFQPDGTWFWNVGHSTQTGYINIAAVTSDASSNVNVVTQNPAAYNVTLPGNGIGGGGLNSPYTWIG